MTAARLDIIIEKKAKYYQEIQVTYADGTPKTMVGKTIRCVIKESHSTDTVLHDLTEANGGIVVVNDALGIYALLIQADDTNVAADFGVYTVVEINDTYPTTETERVIEGKVTYTKGTV